MPLYLLIYKLHLYDTLAALILTMSAAAIPVSVLIMVNFLRDIPRELIGADADRRRQRVDGVPAADLAAVPAGAGHAEHLQRPERVEQLPAAAGPDPEQQRGRAAARA